MNDLIEKLKIFFNEPEPSYILQTGDIIFETQKTRYFINIEYIRNLSIPSSQKPFNLNLVSYKNKADIINDLMTLENDFKILKKYGLLRIKIIQGNYTDYEVFYFTEN